MVSSQLEAFLESMAGECDEKALRAIKANDIFYPVCLLLQYSYMCVYIYIPSMLCSHMFTKSTICSSTINQLFL